MRKGARPKRFVSFIREAFRHILKTLVWGNDATLWILKRSDFHLSHAYVGPKQKIVFLIQYFSYSGYFFLSLHHVMA